MRLVVSAGAWSNRGYHHCDVNNMLVCDSDDCTLYSMRRRNKPNRLFCEDFFNISQEVYFRRFNDKTSLTKEKIMTGK